MTDEEALERAGRIVLLFVSDPVQASSLRFEIARELQRVAQECGWQKEALAEFQACPTCVADKVIRKNRT